MKRITKVLAVLLSCMIAFGAVGCVKNGGDGRTVVSINVDMGGIGYKWAKEAEARYEPMMADKEYRAGEKGVDIDVTFAGDNDLDSIASSGYNIFFGSPGLQTKYLAASGSLLNINDIVTAKDETVDGKSMSIEDKFQPELKDMFKANDGQYYTLPYFSLYPGITYDVTLFESAGCFFADASSPEGTYEIWESDYGNARFVVKDTSYVKSCGNDGELGTWDDGMPTSVEELFILADKLSANGIVPFTISGMYVNYIYYLVYSFWASLAGKAEMDAIVQGKGDILAVKKDNNGEIVFTNENLFEGINYIKKPETEKITLGEQNSHRLYDSYARYVTTCIVEVLEREGWWSKDSYTGTVDHIMAQNNFVFGGKQNKPKIAMLLEGNYWYNESRDNMVFDDYALATNETDKNLAFMPLPSSVDEPITSKENARKTTMINQSRTFSFINANIADDPGLVEACKDFLRFCFTNEELSHFTGCTGVYLAGIDYNSVVKIKDDDVARLSIFQKSVLNMREKADVVGGNFGDKWSSDFLYPNVGVKYNGYLKAVRDGKTALEIFKATMLNG